MLFAVLQIVFWHDCVLLHCETYNENITVNLL
jgi:hypothetical protein